MVLRSSLLKCLYRRRADIYLRTRMGTTSSVKTEGVSEADDDEYDIDSLLDNEQTQTTKDMAGKSYIPRKKGAFLYDWIGDTDPPPKPPIKMKKDLVPDITMFAQIDKHCKKAPSSVKVSVQSLALYLCEPAKSHLEMVRAFYIWIQRNISYDTDSYFGKKRKPSDADSVLQRGFTICLGYTNLFEELCRTMGIPVKSIVGYGKGFSYHPLKGFALKERTNHIWNVVLIENEWRFVDCTWGTGFVDRQRKFHKDYNDFYFLTDPEVFISDHFPYIKQNIYISEKWQLLKEPLDVGSFSKRMKPSRISFEYGVSYISHKDSEIDVEKEMEMFIRTSGEPLTNISATLVEKDSTKQSEYILIEELGNNIHKIKIRPPAELEYKFTLYGSKGKDPIRSLATYYINCYETDEVVLPFSEEEMKDIKKLTRIHNYGFSQDVDKKCFIVAPDGELVVKYPFEKVTSVKYALSHSNYDIPNIEDYVLLQSTAEAYTVTVRFPRTGEYVLSFYAQPLVSFAPEFVNVARYLLICNKTNFPLYKFPKALKGAYIYQTTLIGPTRYDILPNTVFEFSFVSPILKSVKIGNQTFSKPSGNEWKVEVETPDSGETLEITGSVKGDQYKPLYLYKMR